MSWLIESAGQLPFLRFITPLDDRGAIRLPSVDVDSYNLELKDEVGFVGDRASRRAFRKILDTVRSR